MGSRGASEGFGIRGDKGGVPQGGSPGLGIKGDRGGGVPEGTGGKRVAGRECCCCKGLRRASGDFGRVWA